jgi:hypothetical protein
MAQQGRVVGAEAGLFVAVQKPGNGELVRELIRTGADVNGRGELGRGPTVLQNGCLHCEKSISGAKLEREREALVKGWRETLVPLLEEKAAFSYVTKVQRGAMDVGGAPTEVDLCVDQVLTWFGWIEPTKE